jgi:hypothetical protein
VGRERRGGRDGRREERRERVRVSLLERRDREVKATSVLFIKAAPFQPF